MNMSVDVEQNLYYQVASLQRKFLPRFTIDLEDSDFPETFVPYSRIGNTIPSEAAQFSFRHFPPKS